MANTLAPELPILNRKDFTSDQDVRWCPGCGDYAILAQMQKILPELGLPKENIVFISGIGCSSRFPYYMDTYGIHSIHGRAPTLATGLKLARPELTVFVITGDGDSLSIGGNHLIHALRRNIDINIILFNNRIYGLTKGQFSPTSLAGHKTKSSPMGSVEQPLNPISLALAAEATFVARSIDVETKHLQSILRAAAEHKGTSFVEVYQNCNIFNDGAWKYATDPNTKKDNVLILEQGKPMRFGTGANKGIRSKGLSLEVVELGDDINESDLLVHDANQEDTNLAYALSRLTYPNYPVPIGIFRDVTKMTYETGLLGQVEAAKAVQGEGDLKELYFSSDIWTVTEDGTESSPANGRVKQPPFERAFNDMMAGWAEALTPVQQSLATIAISELVPNPPITCSADETLAVVVDRLKEANQGCALVCDEKGELAGAFTDRDILRVALLVKDLSEVTVGQCMWIKPLALRADLPIARALHAFSVRNQRHLPLCDADNKPVGVITTNHVVEFIKRRLAAE